MLEEQLGEKLFQRSGRRLVLTDVGRMVFEYADQIFALGRELLDAVRDRPTGRPRRFQVGVSDELSKLLAYRFLRPALDAGGPVHIVCREGPLDQLLTELATHALDLVLADAPLSADIKVKAYAHPLGHSSVSVCAAPRLAAAHRARFPRSLDGAPFLLPTEGKTLRRAQDHWFDREGLRPQIAGEFDDSALLKTFGQAGAGLFAVPTVIETEVVRQYGVAVVGRIGAVREQYYAISVERRLKHPSVVAISQAASEILAPPRRRKPV
jgi:LysR family transcriptional activator of nhaA